MGCKQSKEIEPQIVAKHDKVNKIDEIDNDPKENRHKHEKPLNDRE